MLTLFIYFIRYPDNDQYSILCFAAIHVEKLLPQDCHYRMEIRYDTDRKIYNYRTCIAAGRNFWRRETGMVYLRSQLLELFLRFRIGLSRGEQNHTIQ